MNILTQLIYDHFSLHPQTIFWLREFSSSTGGDYYHTSLRSGCYGAHADGRWKIALLSVLRQVESGEVKMLYISPEKLFPDNILSWISTIDIAFFAVDEAHCISSWGHEFRSEYRKLGNLKSHFPNLPIIALTATADATTRRDILTQLSIPDAQVFLSSFDRPNLSLTVLPGRKRIEQIEEFLARHRSES